jgi:hypothetical protein
MNQDERLLEENTARLIRAASGTDARPGPQTRQRMFQILLTCVRERSSEVSFPDVVVSALGGLLMLVAIWLVGWRTGTGISLSTSPTLLIPAVWLLLNLALVPIACIVILKRRQGG